MGKSILRWYVARCSPAIGHDENRCDCFDGTLAYSVYFAAGRRLRCIRWPKRSIRFDGSHRVPGRFRRENIHERAQGRASTGRLRAALSPKTREKAVADQDDVGWPFGMLRDYSLL